jgi:hypothetical protein
VGEGNSREAWNDVGAETKNELVNAAEWEKTWGLLKVLRVLIVLRDVEGKNELEMMKENEYVEVAGGMVGW